jgi:hypothetical protein
MAKYTRQRKEFTGRVANMYDIFLVHDVNRPNTEDKNEI